MIFLSFRDDWAVCVLIEKPDENDTFEEKHCEVPVWPDVEC